MQRECRLARWHRKRAPLGPLGSRRLLAPGVTLLVVTAFAGESTAESAPAAAEPQDPAAQNASAQLEVLRDSAEAGPPDATADAQDAENDDTPPAASELHPPTGYRQGSDQNDYRQSDYPSQRRWYGWQTLISDALTIGVVSIGYALIRRMMTRETSSPRSRLAATFWGHRSSTGRMVT